MLCSALYTLNHTRSNKHQLSLHLQKYEDLIDELIYQIIILVDQFTCGYFSRGELNHYLEGVKDLSFDYTIKNTIGEDELGKSGDFIINNKEETIKNGIDIINRLFQTNIS